MIDDKILINILNSREERSRKQINILKDFPYSLISFTLNTPGAIKDNYLYQRIHKEGLNVIIDTLNQYKDKIKNIEELHKSTGYEGYISVDIEPLDLKTMMVSIENAHELGRLFDIDVFDKGHNQIGRSDLGLESRKCLICEKDARLCMREKNHSYEDLILKIEELSRVYFR